MSAGQPGTRALSRISSRPPRTSTRESGPRATKIPPSLERTGPLKAPSQTGPRASPGPVRFGSAAIRAPGPETQRRGNELPLSRGWEIPSTSEPTDCDFPETGSSRRSCRDSHWSISTSLEDSITAPKGRHSAPSSMIALRSIEAGFHHSTRAKSTERPEPPSRRRGEVAAPHQVGRDRFPHSGHPSDRRCSVRPSSVSTRM